MSGYGGFFKVGTLLSPKSNQRPGYGLEKRRGNGIPDHLKPVADGALFPLPHPWKTLQYGAFSIRKPPRPSSASKFPVVGVDAPQRRTRRMQWDVPPVTNDAWAWLSPRMAAFTRKVVPVKRLGVEFTFRPSRKASYGIA